VGPRNHVFDEVKILPQKGQFGEICADPLPMKIQRDVMWRYVPLQRSVRQRPLLRNFNIYTASCVAVLCTTVPKLCRLHIYDMHVCMVHQGNRLPLHGQRAIHTPGICQADTFRYRSFAPHPDIAPGHLLPPPRTVWLTSAPPR